MGQGLCPDTDGLLSDRNIIVLFWTRAPRTLTGQVAASYFHSMSRAEPVCLLID